MTIYWNPVEDSIDPDTIDVWQVDANGETKIGTADVSGVQGMPDTTGGVAPDAVRERCAEYFFEDSTPGNSPSLNKPGAIMVRDMLALNYERGTPP